MKRKQTKDQISFVVSPSLNNFKILSKIIDFKARISQNHTNEFAREKESGDFNISRNKISVWPNQISGKMPKCGMGALCLPCEK